MLHQVELNESTRGDSRWITGTVALLAIVVFAVSGSQVLPQVIASGAGAGAVDPAHASAFLLNTALVLFAWRRSEQLKKSFAERDAARMRANAFAYRDEVTGLWNRRRLNEVLLETFAARTEKAALILLDLDHFKKINDHYGHAVGDEMLGIAGARIADACPPEAQCFRLGGDEFAVLLCGNLAQTKEAVDLARRLQQSVSAPARVANTVTAVGTSIGLAMLSKHTRRPHDLLKRADTAMYEAKRLGRNRWVAFDSDMEHVLLQRERIEEEIGVGIEEGQFVPFFQPIIDLKSGQTKGFEVLARWRHPKRGMLEPAEFIAFAEACGKISDLSFSVMTQALLIARDWPGEFKVAVNVSPVQFSDPLLAQRVCKILASTGFPAGRLELEIMEQSLLEDQAMALSIITSLKNSGITIVVDDFGMGYSPLTQLGALPFDRIKIDRQFMRNLMNEGQCDALVRALSALGRGLKLPITAEGVETELVQAKLADLGCTDAQGWLFAGALSQEEVEIGYFQGPGIAGVPPNQKFQSEEAAPLKKAV